MREAAPIPRADAWYAHLPEEARWRLFDKYQQGLPWYAVAELAEREHGVKCSRSSFYRFREWMLRQFSAHRLSEAALARAEAERLAEAGGMRGTIADAFVAMANEAALVSGNAAAGKDWVDMAAKLIAAAQKDREIELRAEAQRLDREKFEAAEQRLAAVQEAVKTVKSSGNGLSEESLRKIEEAAGLL